MKTRIVSRLLHELLRTQPVEEIIASPTKAVEDERHRANQRSMQCSVVQFGKGPSYNYPASTWFLPKKPTAHRVSYNLSHRRQVETKRVKLLVGYSV